MADDSRGQLSGPSRTTRPRRARAAFGTGETEEIDEQILEIQTRKHNNDVIIPGFTELLLTTNSALAPSESSAIQSSALNERYFTRPEVIASYRTQAIIETPQFEEFKESVHGGARLRHKDSTGHMVDLSDAAFERRHRKYEGFEKRQRLREKESLKHQHYQLTQRIEKLKGMDVSALLLIPAKYFATPLENEEEEAERRREELLNSAEILSERYHTLLYPGRPRKRKAPKPKNPTSPVRPSFPLQSPTPLHDQLPRSPQHLFHLQKQTPIPEVSPYPSIPDGNIYVPASPRKKKKRANPSEPFAPPLPEALPPVGLPRSGDIELHDNRSSVPPVHHPRRRAPPNLVIRSPHRDSAGAQIEIQVNQMNPSPFKPDPATVSSTLEGFGDRIPRQFPLSPVRGAFQPSSLGHYDGQEAEAPPIAHFRAQLSPSHSSCELEGNALTLQYPSSPSPMEASQERPAPDVAVASSSQLRPSEIKEGSSTPILSHRDIPSPATDASMQHLSFPPPSKVGKSPSKTAHTTSRKNDRTEPEFIEHSIFPPPPPIARRPKGRPAGSAPKKPPKTHDPICPLVQMALSNISMRHRNAKPFGFILPTPKEEEFNLPGWPWGAEQEGDTESQSSMSRSGSLALFQDHDVARMRVAAVGDYSDEEDQLMEDD